MVIRNINDYMSDENERIEGLFKALVSLKGKSPQKVNDLFKAFMAGLSRHILWEEKILFPLIENRLGMEDRGPTSAMREDHRSMEELLQSLREKISGNQHIPDNLEHGLSVMLAAHHQKGREALYPMLDNILDDSEKQKVYQKMKEIPLQKPSS